MDTVITCSVEGSRTSNFWVKSSGFGSLAIDPFPLGVDESEADGVEQADVAANLATDAHKRHDLTGTDAKPPSVICLELKDVRVDAPGAGAANFAGRILPDALHL